MTMLVAAKPLDEGERLLSLYTLGLLDTPAEESFDRITRRAAAALDVPMVALSLVDADRQWFKSRVGLEAAQTPRDISFCGHVVVGRQPLIVGDALRDPRFCDNPLVSGKPQVRAYIGIPVFSLVAQPIGTLCAIDTRPRHFGPEHLAAMRDFADMIRDIIHARERAIIAHGALQAAADQELRYRDTFELSAIGIAHTSLAGQVTRVNPRFCEILGCTPAHLIGRSFVDVTHPDDVAPNLALFLQMTCGEIDRYRMRKRFRCRSGAYVWANLAVALKRDAAGKPAYVIAMVEEELGAPARLAPHG